MENLTTVLVTLIAAGTSAGAWQFWQNRMKMKHQSERAEHAERTLYRDDLRERVAVLEEKLEQSQLDKEKLQLQVGTLLGELREYKVRLELLENENAELRKSKD